MPPIRNSELSKFVRRHTRLLQQINRALDATALDEVPPQLSIRLPVTGRNHYPTVVEAGRIYCLERTPTNPYDANAIGVYSADKGPQVGHCTRALAQLLSPLLDAGYIAVDTAYALESGDRYQVEMVADVTILKGTYKVRNSLKKYFAL